jgi:CRISPR-associated protein Csd1
VGKLILTALYELYERLAADPHSGIAKLGYTEVPVVAAFELSPDGQLIGAVPLGTQKGKNVSGARLMVPERAKKSSGDHSNFLGETMEYVIGVRPGAVGADERSTRRKAVCQNLHLQILGDVDDEGAKAVLRFLSRKPDDVLTNEHLRAVREVVDTGGNIVFRLSGDSAYIHDRPAVRKAWEEHVSRRSEASAQGQCLITGTRGPIARLHPSTKGIFGGQSTGTSLVSFNFKACESYGKQQGDNSPVGERAAFAYGTALNWLTSRDRHHVLAGDTTIVFWAERAGPEEDLTLALLGEALGGHGEKLGDETSSSMSQTTTPDEAQAQKMKSILKMVFRGEKPALGATDFDPEVRFYILGLSPNAARLSVRFWNINTFGGVMENLRRHYDDLSIIHHERARPVSVPRILMELTPPASRKREAIPKVLVGSLMRSILDGTAYPQALLALLISRIRIDSNDPDQPRVERKVNYPRAAYIKAHLRRKARVSADKKLEEGLSEVLNTENKDPGYMLGRLFALLEKAQQDANPGIKATIKDRYYASASATPGAVFPVLIRLAQHHLSKSEYGNRVDKLIEGVISQVGSFPNHMTLDQQGLFALGYYQQRAALYVKAEEEKKGGENSDDAN